MKSFSTRMQLGLVALGYAAVIAFAAVSLYQRHLLELQDPAGFSGGMAAEGDTMLQLFIGGLFLIPTTLLIWIGAKFETAYMVYSKFLLGVSLSAPVCLAVLLLGLNRVADSIGWICWFRVLGSPIVFVGMCASRFVARSERAKQLITRALLVEGLTIALMVGGFAVEVFIRAKVGKLV